MPAPPTGSPARQVVCLAVLLLNFERIDALMQLCADVQRLVDQKQKVSVSFA